MADTVKGISALIEEHDRVSEEILQYNKQQEEINATYHAAVEQALETWRKEVVRVGRLAMVAAEKQQCCMEAIQRIAVNVRV